VPDRCNVPQVSEEEEAWAIRDRVVQAGKVDGTVRPEHYKPDATGKQHWDRAWEQYREAWFVLNITKYVERYRSKDGIKDLRKARTYLDKLIELEEAEAAQVTDKQGV
jgi:hypothetical protein